ncbi:MAG: hypothetical protein J6Z11_14630 [Candidatus Riflebacteria bacterium]|nr:hypothetical protein [Candidatus Riflebacteria bacterium]
MLSAVKGYFDGNKIVVDDDIQLAIGQRVIITILEEDNNIINKNREHKLKIVSEKDSLIKPLGLEEISNVKLDNDLKASCQEMLDGKVTSINEVLKEYEPDFKI